MITVSGREIYNRLAALQGYAAGVFADAAEARALADLAAVGHPADAAKLAARLAEVSHMSAALLADLDGLCRAARRSVGSDLVILTVDEQPA